jgi:membrane-bound lytic murein transglycosylase D
MNADKLYCSLFRRQAINLTSILLVYVCLLNLSFNSISLAAPTTLDTQKLDPVSAKESILNDSENRVSDSFSIPADLRERVGFWFDVYSRYGTNQKVIHFANLPWIVFKVIDVSDIVNSDKPRFKWMRVEKGDRLVKAEVDHIRKATRSVAVRKNLNSLNEYEKLVVDALRPLGGDVRKHARSAVGAIRVQTGQRDFFTEGLRVSPRYLGEMEQIFIKNKLPIELTRLPFVESSFNRQAVSKVGASGVWQIIANTGRKFMIVNNAIDERISPLKATQTAAQLLKENFSILHRSWPLAITAWNHGPSGVRTAIQGSGSRELGKIISRFHSRNFDFASSNFYCEFLAALHAQIYRDKLFEKVEQDPPINEGVIKLSRSVRPSILIKAIKISSEEFLRYNPDLKGAVLNNLPLPIGYHLHIPSGSISGVERLFFTRGVYVSKAASGSNGL